MSGIPVFSAGTSLQSSGVSVSAQIPADSAGMLPLFVRVTATAAGYFRLSKDGESATVGDLLVQPSDGLILKTCGLSQFSFVSQSGTSTVTVTPIDVGGIKYPANIFTPAALFTTGINGAWYDLSDFSTMFQDAAGTTPVTAVGQPVGRILDKSGRGNHAYNPSGNSANFPVLSARYNLLTKTEDFSAAAWSKILGATTPSANTIVFTATDGSRAEQSTAIIAKAGDSYIASCVLSGSGTVGLNLSAGDGLGGEAETVVTLTSTPTRYFAALTFKSGVSGTGVVRMMVIHRNTMSATTVTATNADLRVANDALNQPTYQRVNTATDYDTAGFNPYLSFNGVNQWLQTNSIDLTYGDKMFVCAGVRKLSDAAAGFVVELSSSADTTNGSFYLLAPYASNPSFGFGTRGSSLTAVYATGYTSPVTSVVSASYDNGGATQTDEIKPRINGSTVTVTDGGKSATAGTGNYGNYPFYIGARADSSLWFNGRLYGLVVAGKAASASEIASTEAWLNQKTGAY